MQSDTLNQHFKFASIYVDKEATVARKKRCKTKFPTMVDIKLWPDTYKKNPTLQPTFGSIKSNRRKNKYQKNIPNLDLPMPSFALATTQDHYGPTTKTIRISLLSSYRSYFEFLLAHHAEAIFFLSANRYVA